jgi:hypothetical protein
LVEVLIGAEVLLAAAVPVPVVVVVVMDAAVYLTTLASLYWLCTVE